MKRLRIILLSLAVSAPAARAADAPAAPPARDAATHDQLVPAYRQSQQDDPMRHLAPAQGPDPMLANPPKDLISESDILCFGGAATLVPKQAVIHIPKNLAERLKFIPGSKILTWADFFTINRGWITTVEVSRAQAEGNQPMVEEIATRVNKSSNLVVATYQGGPISLLPPKVPPPTEPAAQPTGKPAAKSPAIPVPTGKKQP